MKSLIKIIFILAIIGQSCKKSTVNSAKISLFNGTFKAKEVKEGTAVVFRQDATNNIIPGYSKYRITFTVLSTGRRNVKIIEYSGEVFEGTWGFDEATNILTFSNLSPKPAAGNLVFNVTTIEQGLLVLVNNTPNPKTGNTLNQYTLIPE